MIKPNRNRYLVAIITLTLLVSGCSSFKKLSFSPKLKINYDEQGYYNAAKRLMNNGRYYEATEMLEELESRYPFGRYAEQAQLDLVFARYKSKEYEAARAAADRFIRLHPRHPDLDYAYYYRGLSSDLSGKSLFSNLLPIDRTQRDPGASRDSFNDFALLVESFPDSKYLSDARLRMVHLRNKLAAYEIHVARYYLRRGSYVAAANRGRYVVENFQTTPAVPDGLAVMVEAYQQLGMPELSEQSFNVLALNYPDYPALGKDGSFDIKRTKIGSRPSFVNSATFGLFGRSASK